MQSSFLRSEIFPHKGEGMFPENNESLVNALGVSQTCSFFSHESMDCSQRNITPLPANVNSCTFQPLSICSCYILMITDFPLPFCCYKEVTHFSPCVSLSLSLRNDFPPTGAWDVESLACPSPALAELIVSLLFLKRRALHDGCRWARNGWIRKQQITKQEQGVGHFVFLQRLLI